MAITSTETTAKAVRTDPDLLTYVDTTLVLDGSLSVLAIAGIAHGGPTGRTPYKVTTERRGGTSTATILHDVNITNFDTTNDEVDLSVYLSGAGTNTETVIIRVFFHFLEQASGGVS
jgi:hypothetical protein